MGPLRLQTGEIMAQSDMKLKKIIWSIDAFEEKENLQERAARVLSAFQNKTFAQIEPVFVLAATDLNWPADYSNEWMHEFEENLRVHLEKVLLTSGFPQVLTPKILLEPLASTSASVETLLEYAVKEAADLILVSSHGRKGLDRFFLGSFAETVLVHSHIPVMVIGHAVKMESQMGRILFPTEFGENSRETFRRVISIAKQLQSAVTIFHSVPMPARIVMDTGYYPSMYGIEGEMVSFEDFMKIQAEHQVRRAESWAEWAKGEGVDCDFIVDASGEAVDDLICNEVKALKSDLIIMEGQSGPIKVALLGSITRSVVRVAECPVLVFPRHSLVKVTEPEIDRENRVEQKTIDLDFRMRPAGFQDYEV
jgi:nucleotide-binding universal stress UspA family protein